MSRGDRTISVALPVYNGAEYIEIAISSLLAQIPQCEIVVSDDGSSDATVAKVEAIRSPRVKLVRSGTRGGQFVNFNRAMKECAGEYIQLFSHDDVALEGFLQSQLAAFDRSTDIGLVYASYNIIDEDGQRRGVLDDDGTPLIIDFETYLHISSRYGS